MTNIKVGDKVRVKDEENTGFFDQFRGSCGTVATIQNDNRYKRLRVVFEDGRTDTGWIKGVELINPSAPAIPDEIEINGTKYRRVIEEAAPETRTPELGSVWRDSLGDIVYIARVGEGLYQAVQLDGSRDFWGEPRERPATLLRDRDPERWQFIAPSLADALERGLITAADLR